jgi:hypothetical protein
MRLPAMPWSSRARRPLARARGAGWPDNAQRTTFTVYGPHPIAVATVAAIDRTDGLGLRGRSGAVRIGAEYQFSGYMASRRVLSPVGQSLGLVASPNTALPGTVVPVDAQGPIMSLLAQIPPSSSSRG